MLPRYLIKTLSCALAVAWLTLSATLASAATITNDTFWRDTAGNPIYSQGGGIFKFGSKYYWYGVKYNGAVTYQASPTGKNSDTSFNAVTCYSSTDLVNWTFENNILTASTPGLGSVSWMGRLGVVFNANTNRYVLLCQYGGSLGAGELFASGTSPTANFSFNNLQSPVPGVANGTTGDQTVFTDTDGKSYLICSSSSGRSNWYVTRIRESDSLALETAVRIGGGRGREGNCMFKHNGRYYFCSSELFGWNSSHCFVISATNIMGPYSAESVMAGTDADFCHVSQTGFFVTVAGSAGTTVIFAGDRWSDFAGNGIGYNQWCPLTFNGTTPTFQSVSKWDLNAAAGTWSVAPGNNYILNPTYEADRILLNAVAGWTSTGTAGAFGNGNTGRTGRFFYRHSSTAAYNAFTRQVVTGLPNGTYTLKVWYQSSGGQATARIYAANYGGAEIQSNVNTAQAGWAQRTISNINVTNGQCELGIFSVATASQWLRVDDWELTRNGGVVVPPTGDTYAAESGTAGGGTLIETNNGGFNGTGFANFPASGGTLVFDNVDGNGGGTKSLAIRYANGTTAARTGTITVNGATSLLTFAPTGSWTTWATANVNITLLNNATNQIQFASTGNDLGNIDEIRVP